jgi:signal transduction histidine kinase
MQALDAVSQIAAPLVARGRPLGVVSFVRSSTLAPFVGAEREIAEEIARRTATAIDNAQLFRAAVAASDAKSTFLASMSHELRTPLTAIIGYEELLADGITGPVTEPQRQQLGRIKASATHLLGLIDEILTFSRVEAGSEQAYMELVDVSTVLADAASLVAPLVDERGLLLTVELPENAACIRTDAQKVRQILVNLLSNATKFTERGGITLSACRRKRQMHFLVRDTGIGIPSQHLQQIFEPFWQVDQRANRRVGGTGLGLTVSRRLAQLIGGDLSVESRDGGGSTFTLQLPADTA